MKRVLPAGSVMPRTNPHLMNGVPQCPDSECKAKAVRWRGVWVCPNCFEFATDETDFDGKPKRVALGELMPNRAARRARR